MAKLTVSLTDTKIKAEISAQKKAPDAGRTKFINKINNLIVVWRKIGT